MVLMETPRHRAGKSLPSPERVAATVQAILPFRKILQPMARPWLSISMTMHPHPKCAVRRPRRTHVKDTRRDRMHLMIVEDSVSRDNTHADKLPKGIDPPAVVPRLGTARWKNCIRSRISISPRLRLRPPKWTKPPRPGRLCGGELSRLCRVCRWVFLSRLCGGERSDSVVERAILFLSRLCGGERVQMWRVSCASFLSRLCGGELSLLYYMRRSTFLSRLCGGELWRAILWVGQIFLSRLCGGEPFPAPHLPRPLFLSRLCGGEHTS